MFLRQLPDKELSLFLKFTALITAIDKPAIEIIPLEREVHALTEQYNHLKKQGSNSNGISSIFSIGKDLAKDALLPIEDKLSKKTIELSIQRQTESISGFNIEKQNKLLVTLLNNSNTINTHVIEEIISPAYADFHTMLLTMYEDVDEEIPHSSEAEYRFIYGTKLSKRYIKEANIIELTNSAKRIMIYDLYSVGLLNKTITDLQDKMIKKIANLLDIEEGIITELKSIAEEVHKKNIEALALFVKEVKVPEFSFPKDRIIR
jgi:hypothetical protein